MKIDTAITTQHILTYGDRRSPTRADFQNMPSRLCRKLATETLKIKIEELKGRGWLEGLRRVEGDSGLGVIWRNAIWYDKTTVRFSKKYIIVDDTRESNGNQIVFKWLTRLYSCP
jgi:hypothetical protein